MYILMYTFPYVGLYIQISFSSAWIWQKHFTGLLSFVLLYMAGYLYVIPFYFLLLELKNILQLKIDERFYENRYIPLQNSSDKNSFINCYIGALAVFCLHFSGVSHMTTTTRAV